MSHTSTTTLLGPGSLHWTHVGDNRILFMLARAGMLQLMEPGLGAGVEQHSDFFTEPWERVFRSVPQIAGTVYDWPHAEHTARHIRDYHRHIKGTDAHGRRYHALDPEIYFWAHATIFDATVQALDTFGPPLSLADKERFYAESREIYRQYGVSDRAMPPDWASFREYFDRTCRERLELTTTAAALAGMVGHPPPTMPLIPQPLYRLVKRPLIRILWWFAVATYPQPVRDLLGARWTAADERRFRRFAAAVRRVWPLLPARLRLSAAARASYRRTGHGPG